MRMSCGSSAVGSSDLNSSLRVYTSSDSIPDHTLRVRNLSWRFMGKKNDHLSRDNKTSIGTFYTICPIMDTNPYNSASNCRWLLYFTLQPEGEGYEVAHAGGLAQKPWGPADHTPR